MAKKSAAASGHKSTQKRPAAQKAASSSARAGAKKSGARTRKAAPQANRLWSILLFALALLLAALAWIPGQAAWIAVRGACFGVFGWALYLTAPALLYLAVLVAAGRPWRGKLALCLLILLLVCGTGLVFTGYQPDGAPFGKMVQQLYQMGTQRQGGGVFAVPLGLSLLCWAGRPAANILLLILLLVFVMVLADFTPADLVDALRHTASRAHESASDALVERDRRREEKRAESQQRQAEREAQRTARRRPRVDPQLPPESLSKPRDRWNIDVHVADDIHVTPAAQEADAPPPPLDAAKGAAFDPDDHPELDEVLEHDVLAAAGREALRPTPKDADEPFVQDMVSIPAWVSPASAAHKPLFDQDAEPAGRRMPAVPTAEPVGQPVQDEAPFAEAETPAAQADEQPMPMPETPEADGTPAAPAQASEIDSLIRRALDGRPIEEDATLPDGLGTAKQAESPAAAPPAPELPPYHLPSPELLDRQPNTDQSNVNDEMRRNADILVNTLESFGVKTKILDICRGPSVTRYELQPLAGVKISRITNLADDIALNLASAGVRIEAPIPGKPAVGIEVPNKVKTTVALRSLIQSDEFRQSTAPLTMCLGRDIAGSVKLADLSKMPHLLIAGSTGSGKSVCINSIIMSFLYKSTPDDLRMILIDPKVVELAEYNGVPHLLMPVVTEPRKAAGALGCAVAEMERRYHLFADNNVRDIKSYNRLAAERGELEHLPYIAILIDELADLMMVAGKQVEDYICRIAQKARAAGMHLIVATQRPSVDVITGLIKANIPSRIAFAVSSQIDSRTILDAAGAEKLLGMGDMLFLPVGASKPVRIQGTFVKDSEIERVIGEIKSYADSRYDEQMIAETDRRATASDAGSRESDEDDDDGQDPMLQQAMETVVEAGMASTSLLQRKLKLGYARAARIMDEMEALHVIGPYEGSKPRQVLITRDQLLERSMRSDAR